MQDYLREQKQKYLRENIIDKDYDPEEFMDFCENQKGTIDIDSWTLDQLQHLVNEFVHTNNFKDAPFKYQKTHESKIEPIDWDNAFSAPAPSKEANLNLNLIDLDFLESMGGSGHMGHPPALTQSQVPKNEQKKPSADSKDILFKLNDKNTQFISAYNSFAMGNREKEQNEKERDQRAKEQREKEQKNKESSLQVSSPLRREMRPQQELVGTAKESVVIDEQFRATVKCRTFANKPRLQQDCEVIVTGHEVINPNPFVPNYVLYSIRTAPVGVEVKRRLKDFQSFRNLLRKLFPTTQIPLLQRYGGRLSETEPAVIRKQKLFLESFLNGLLMNRALRCKIVDEFLLCQSLDALKKVFRELEKLERPKSIEELYNWSGKLEVHFSPSSRKFVSQQELYFDYLQTNLLKLKELYDQLAANFANSIRLLTEISELYDNLRDSTKNVNALLPEPLQTTRLEATFDKVSDLHKHWGLSVKTQAKILEVEVRHLCRYEACNIETIRDLCKVSDSLVEAYSKRSDKAEAAREQYEFNKRLNDFKTGLESPSKSTTYIAGQSGCCGSRRGTTSMQQWAKFADTSPSSATNSTGSSRYFQHCNSTSARIYRTTGETSKPSPPTDPTPSCPTHSPLPKSSGDRGREKTQLQGHQILAVQMTKWLLVESGK